MKRVKALFLLLLVAVFVSVLYFKDGVYDDDDELSIENLTLKYCPAEKTHVSVECLRKLAEYDTGRIETKQYRVFYHTFWEPSKAQLHHGYVMKLNIMSFLATQDLARARLVVWTLKKIEIEHGLVGEFKRFIDRNTLEFRVLDFPRLCSKGVYNMTCYRACSSMKYGHNMVALSDFVRFLVLYNYGGIYVDGDVMFLRDMKPFWRKNFVYRWSATSSYNTAIMGISDLMNENTHRIYLKILNSSANTVQDLVRAFYPSKVSKAVSKLNNGNTYNFTGLRVYHSVVFDPAWLCNDHFKLNYKSSVCRFSEFYEKLVEKFNPQTVFPGSFTHHLHLGNCGSCKLKNGSYFSHFMNYFESKIK